MCVSPPTTNSLANISARNAATSAATTPQEILCGQGCELGGQNQVQRDGYMRAHVEQEQRQCAEAEEDTRRTRDGLRDVSRRQADSDSDQHELKRMGLPGQPCARYGWAPALAQRNTRTEQPGGSEQHAYEDSAHDDRQRDGVRPLRTAESRSEVEQRFERVAEQSE